MNQDHKTLWKGGGGVSAQRHGILDKLRPVHLDHIHTLRAPPPPQPPPPLSDATIIAKEGLAALNSLIQTELKGL